MKNFLALGLCAVGLLGLGMQSAAAQGDDRAGTQAMEELLVPVTPRTVALGSSLTGGLGDLNGVEAVQSNPAGVLSSTGTNAMFSRSEYIDDVGISFVGISQTFGANAIALSLLAWDYGDIPEASEINPDPVNSTWTAQTYSFGATYSRRFTDRIGAGVTLKALGRRMDDVNSTGLAFDTGISYAIPDAGLRFGVALKNLGSDMSFSGSGLQRDVTNVGPNGPRPVAGEIDDLSAVLPSSLSFGASYTRQFQGNVSVSTLANFVSGSYDLDQYSGGLELGYANLVYARGGINMISQPDQDTWQGWNLGAGLNLNLGGTALRVDYAFRPTDRLGNVNMFAVGIDL